ncbi:O-antigen polysaccharide polymerase Wzy [Paenibacillus taiwanensis]|uniref:O-antigen polysaccharide polymerase Wzy n=1 Tax=Paenibacillus taiwanensis TaxID=401638 RepID=UPI000415CD3E|nr:O-antigen polysaccharide polymerase Wzy [Paenibacillus taiwanensis]
MSLRRITLAGISVALVPVIIYSALHLMDQDPISFYIWSIVLMNLIAGYWSMRMTKSASFFSSLIAMFLLFTTMYSITYPLDHVMGSLHNLSEERLVQILQLYVLANISLIAGIVVMTCLTSVNVKWDGRMGAAVKRKAPELPLQQQDKSSIFDILYWPSLIVLLMGIAMMIYDQMRLGGFSVIGVSNRLSNFQAQRQLEGLSLPWKAIITSSLLTLALSIRTTKQRHLFYFITLMLGIFFFFGLGSRGFILITILPCLGVMIDRGYIKMTKWKQGILVALMLLLLSPIFTNFRMSLIEGVPMDSMPEQSWAFSNGETGSSFIVTADILSVTDYPEADPSYTTALGYVLPSAVYKGITGHAKPLNIGDWYVWYFYPYIYAEGGGKGFSPLAQAWMNGGLGAVIAVFAIIGALLVWASRGHFIKYLALPLTMTFQRMSFHAIVADLVYELVFILIILLLAALMRPKAWKWLKHAQPEETTARSINSFS